MKISDAEWRVMRVVWQCRSATAAEVIEQLVPISRGEIERSANHHWDYLYEPGGEEVLTALLVRYLDAFVYQAVVENIACEQAARMVAMKAASDNTAFLSTRFFPTIRLALRKIGYFIWATPSV